MLKHILNKNEHERRKIDLVYDSSPSIAHKLNFQLSKPYIKNKVVLDAGCWTGQFEKLSVRYVKKIYGIDPGREAVDYASSTIKNAEFKVGRVENMPFDNNFFDAVVFFDVIEHLPKGCELKALKEINRVLKKGGFLILSTPNSHILSVMLDPAYFLIGHRHYSVKALVELLNTSGFAVVKTHQTAGVFRLITSNVEYAMKHLFGVKVEYPSLINKRLKKEMKSGYVQNHVVAQKLF